MEKIYLDTSEGKYFPFCLQAANYHGLVQALLKGGQNKPHKNFSSQKRYSFKFSLKMCTYLAGLITFQKLDCPVLSRTLHACAPRCFQTEWRDNTSFV